MLTVENPAGARLYLPQITWEAVATDANGYVIPGTTRRGDTRDEVLTDRTDVEATARQHAATWGQQLTDCLLVVKEYSGYDLRSITEHRLGQPTS